VLTLSTLGNANARNAAPAIGDTAPAAAPDDATAPLGPAEAAASPTGELAGLPVADEGDRESITADPVPTMMDESLAE